MRLNPFTMWWEHRRNQKAVLEMARKVGEDMRHLLEQVAKHQAETAHELFKLKNPWYARHDSTVENPLTEEQEKIVKEFNENNKLPEQIRRSFASGGHIGMRAALGRFGEAPSEQTRSTDSLHAIEPGNVNIEVLIRAEQRVMDREAWDNLDLDDIPAPKE